MEILLMNLFSNVSNYINLKLDDYVSKFKTFKLVSKIFTEVGDSMKLRYSDIYSLEYISEPDTAIYLQYLYRVANPQPNVSNIHDKDYYYIDTSNSIYQSYKKVTEDYVYDKNVVYYVSDNTTYVNKIKALEKIKNMFPLVWNVFKLCRTRILEIDPEELFYVCNYCYKLKGRLESIVKLTNYILNSSESVIIDYSDYATDPSTGKEYPVNLNSYVITINKLTSVTNLAKFKVDFILLSRDLLFNTHSSKLDITAVSYNYVNNSYSYIINDISPYNYWKIKISSDYKTSTNGSTINLVPLPEYSIN